MRAAVDNALNAGLAPNDIITGIRKGFEQVSAKYDTGEFFLSELIMSGETAKVALEVLESQCRRTFSDRTTTKVVIGTVEGDVHDIGKNIVSTILLSSGLDVYDLGTDVKSEDFIRKIKETGATVLAMSALLTTTMQNMGTVVADLKKNGLRESVKVVVGGQPLTDSFAQQIGADSYVDDAPKILRVLGDFAVL